MKNYFLLSLIILVSCVSYFFSPFLINGKIPIPADTIVGLYHPFRDLYANDYPRGVPYKNFLITDPVRQQYPWRFLTVESVKQNQLPLWNPYTMTGVPLLGNMQSAPFYPLNIFLYIVPLQIGWGILIYLQMILGGIFFFLYTKNLKLSNWSCLLGSLAFIFSGFSIAWLEWGTIVHTAVWLPLILLSIDKLFDKLQGKKLTIDIFKNKNLLFWSLLYVFSLSAALFAGHLQIFFYLLIVVISYFIIHLFGTKNSFHLLLFFCVLNIVSIAITWIQWYPALQYIFYSARSVDVSQWNETLGWFIPWEHAIQFIVPDFFGNPTTLNYWGVWNYGELIGYIGILPLIMALYALFFRRDKKTLYFGTVFFIAVIFAFPTIFAQLPFLLNIPFISTSQPTRLLFIIDFCLAMLAALGFDYFNRRKKYIVYPLLLFTVSFVGLWVFVTTFTNLFPIITTDQIAVSKNNLILPTLIYISVFILIVLFLFEKFKKIRIILCILLFTITIFDLTRFAQKFTPFTNSEYLYPSTKLTEYLQKNTHLQRIMSLDNRILPPNFTIMYELQSVDGYDPLYLLRYGELIVATERSKPDISLPFGFNRIITPKNVESPIIDMLGVKYILSLTEVESEKLEKVFQEGETRVYRNNNAFPKAYFVENVIPVNSSKEALQQLFRVNLLTTGVVEDLLPVTSFTKGTARIESYSPNYIQIKVTNADTGFLILTDSFYPTWNATIDGVKTTIFKTNYNYRGIVVPSGNHVIEYKNTFF